MENNLITLTGTVESVTFSNEGTGFTVFELDTGAHLVTVVGEMPGAAAGEEVSLTGRFTTHPTYGEQFKAELCERKLPATATAIRKYLCSGVIKGIGPSTARNIVDAFGDDTLEIIEKEPHKLAQVRGVSAKKAQDIHERYRQVFGIRAAMLYLSRLGVEGSDAIRIWKLWGPLTQQMVEHNPYQLCCEAAGIPFPQADAAAAGMGVERLDPRRLRAGLEHVLSHNLQNGHTCLPLDKLIPTAAALMDVQEEEELLSAALEEAGAEGAVVTAGLAGRAYASLSGVYEAEAYIAARLNMMLQNFSPNPTGCGEDIDRLEKELGIEYDPLQRRAVEMALQNGAFILTGGPGTGKTTCMGAILSLLERRGERVALAAPTGRAAKRMSEVTGHEASTIHRLLEPDFRDPETGRHRFRRNDKNPLRATTVILDEASMVDTPLMHSLIRALRMSCRLILVGDPDQLPSVGPGNILRDLIAGEKIPAVHLDRIFRQARQSRIVRNAHLIVNGDPPELTGRDGDFFFIHQKQSYEETAKTVAQLCVTRLPAAYGFSPLWDIQVIVPGKNGALGTRELNKLLQERLNPPDPRRAQYLLGNVVFREQDKVMQVKNNYDIPWERDDGEKGAGVFNGDIGVIEMIDRPSRTLLIRYDDRVAQYTMDMADEIEHAYAITVHKSQGSEFEAVVMPLMDYHPRLHYRNILYTGVTRARKILILLGKPETVHRMTANHRKVLRYTRLAHLMARPGE